ncbi:hypothetical protein V0R37_14500 [Pollutimonas sp. H1-120]|uniref:hypothetical protein n=1 Tax=Pollutimonas sp. H1-120 TaxID=3148824 RepID=UPI003B5291D2
MRDPSIEADSEVLSEQLKNRFLFFAVHDDAKLDQAPTLLGKTIAYSFQSAPTH